jgi:hypothetical protein
VYEMRRSMLTASRYARQSMLMRYSQQQLLMRSFCSSGGSGSHSDFEPKKKVAIEGENASFTFIEQVSA